MNDSIYEITCVHHNDAERGAITCPVCLAAQLASAKEENARLSNTREDWRQSWVSLNTKTTKELKLLREQLATVTKERDEAVRDIAWNTARNEIIADRDSLRSQLAAANERADRAESERDSLCTELALELLAKL